MTMNVRDRWSGLFFLAFSIFVCVEAIGMDVGTFHVPGPGFLPFWSGVVFGIFSIILVVRSVLSKPGGEKAKNLWKGTNWGRVIMVLASLFIYAVFLQELGYLLATFGLMTLMFGMMGKTRWWVRVVTAALTVLATYFIFYAWLDVQLPKGILGY
jgi:putative tricarboxylic transport membrane protein